MKNSYAEMVQASNSLAEAYRDDLSALAGDLLAACTDSNSRPGRQGAWNMPSELNSKLEQLYTKYSKKNINSDGCSWQCVNGSGYTLDILGMHIHYYGKAANKFFLTVPPTQEERDRVYQAIERAVEDSDKY